uniref:Uncharacterized protein n=1 Tax=Sphaerodactylus townsendi TaxID=933632 RepID=A0ACB8FDT8_9SAUR
MAGPERGGGRGEREAGSALGSFSPGGEGWRGGGDPSPDLAGETSDLPPGGGGRGGFPRPPGVDSLEAFPGTSGRVGWDPRGGSGEELGAPCGGAVVPGWPE